MESGPTRRPAILKWLIIVFVFSMVFDSIALPLIASRGTLSKLVGILIFFVFVMSAASSGPKLRWYGGDLGWFFVFFVVVAGQEVYRLSASSADEAEARAFFSYVQIFVMFLIFRDLTRDTRIYRGILAVFVLTYVPASVLTLLDVPFLTVVGNEGRMGLAGSNVNQVGFFYAVITVFIVTWVMTRIEVPSIKGILALAAAAFLVAAIGRTGSRGAAVALAAGLLATTLLNFRTSRASKYLLLLPLLLGGAAFLLVSQEVLVDRMTATLVGGDTGGREELASSSIELALAKPWTGYGASYSLVLGEALDLDGAIAAHNTYLQILLSFGLMGCLPFLLGVFGVVKTTWLRRRSVWGSVWLSVLVMTLVFGITAHVSGDKYFWIMLALAANASVMADVSSRVPIVRKASREVLRGVA